MRVLRADGLARIAWFNLGVSYGKSKEWEHGVVCFLIAALISPGDSEAWANALVCFISCLRAENPAGSLPVPYFGLIALAAAQWDREALFRALMDRLPPDTAEGRQIWQDLLALLADKADPPPVIRLTIGGRIVEIPLDDPEAALRAMRQSEPLPDAEA